MNKKIKSLLTLIVEVTLLVTLFYVFAFPYRVDGDSMESSYHTGDRVIISHISAWIGNIDRGDTVVCSLEDMTVIKRIIALPGDNLLITDGKVYLNGSLLDEPYIDADEYTSGDISITLGDDEYFVMGDNRSVSLDSRQAGCISRRDINGIVWFKF